MTARAAGKVNGLTYELPEPVAACGLTKAEHRAYDDSAVVMAPIHETVRPVSACLAFGGSTAEAGNLETLSQAE